MLCLKCKKNTRDNFTYLECNSLLYSLLYYNFVPSVVFSNRCPTRTTSVSFFFQYLPYAYFSYNHIPETLVGVSVVPSLSVPAAVQTKC